MNTITASQNRIEPHLTAITPDVEKLVSAIEALLFASHEPLAPSALHSLNGHTGWTFDDVVVEINRRMEESSHPMRVRKVAGGYQMYLLPEYGPIIESVLVKTRTQRLSRAGLETLAIIAYRQPCTTPEIERIRGVATDASIRTLLERNLIAIRGRSEGPGRPLLYGTTPEFLRYFGLNAIDDLPREDELTALLAARTEEKQRELAAEMQNQADSPPLKLHTESGKGDASSEFRIENVVTSAGPNLNN